MGNWIGKVFRIFTSDFRHTARNWIAVVICIGLIVLPSLYAWINILASTDPYGSTGNIKVAVANLDEGGNILDRNINIGNQLVEELEKNDSLGWTFYETRKDAVEAVRTADVYAAVIIPENFSSKMCTMLQHPEKAELEYCVNLKKNAIAPKMTNAGVSEIQKKIKETMISEVFQTVYEGLNQAGYEIEGNYDKIEDFKEFLFQIEPEIPKTEGRILAARDKLQGALDTVEEKEGELETVKQLAVRGQALISGLITEGNRMIDRLAALEPELLQLLEHAGETAETIEGMSAKFLETRETLQAYVEKLTLLSKVLDGLVPGWNDTSQREDLISQINTLCGEISHLSGRISALLEKDIFPFLEKYTELSADLGADVITALGTGVTELNRLSELAEKFKTAGKTAMGYVDRFLDVYPEISSDAMKALEQLHKIDDQIDLKYVAELLESDASEESDFFANPVEVKTTELFPMANYGAGMTPFYTTLCLWVGALILCALLTPYSRNADFPFTLRQEFFGKWMFFVFLAMMQGLIVSLGNIFLLGIQIAHPALFVLLSMFYSLVFTTMVFTFVYQLGNVGKALSVILLVVQIAGSGGTFPIEVTPQYFQNIYSVLPFTYAISGMREAVAGIVPENLAFDLCVLAGYLAVFLMLGLISRHWIKKVTGKLHEKLAEANITEH